MKEQSYWQDTQICLQQNNTTPVGWGGRHAASKYHGALHKISSICVASMYLQLVSFNFLFPCVLKWFAIYSEWIITWKKKSANRCSLSGVNIVRGSEVKMRHWRMPSFWGRCHLKFWWIVSQIVFCCDVILLYYLLQVIFIHSRPEYFNVVSATSGAVDAVCLFQTFSCLIAFIFKSVASQMSQGRVAVRRVCVFFQHCARLCESADAQNGRQLLCIQTKALKKPKTS